MKINPQAVKLFYIWSKKHLLKFWQDKNSQYLDKFASGKIVGNWRKKYLPHIAVIKANFHNQEVTLLGNKDVGTTLVPRTPFSISLVMTNSKGSNKMENELKKQKSNVSVPQHLKAMWPGLAMYSSLTLFSIADFSTLNDASFSLMLNYNSFTR